ncbi:type I polyketide synthase [Sphingobacterium kitahiroshimense]|uniref:SDR family NAD(P)-dependent oxidoreductase n=1 Tax=Sphingobacterium kitahiroshimense TaxID=470446 RepID=A0ABV0BX27_9SPHI
MQNQSTKKDIAVIGLAGKFPKSLNIEEYWNNLIAGKEMSTFFSKETSKEGVSSEKNTEGRNHIAVSSEIAGAESFDYSFFGYTSAEAALMDPQIRLFHEYAWLALEDAGYNPYTYKEKIGLYAAANDNINWRAFALNSNTNKVNPFYLNQISDKNYIASLVAYKLNLRGPVLYIDTACSSSLVTIHLACRALLLKECSIALAGGVRINTSKEEGYFYQDGMIFSKDGHCKPFDSDSSGTISGEGIGIVVLKRFEDAIKDGDRIYAVIKSSAVNNDGNDKIGFSAPSVNGQANCIISAHKMAGIDSRSITYVETHGTGTALGDPIEVEALNTAFNKSQEKKCAIGSVKSNMGHLSAAAGIAGFIKVVLSLKNKIIPPLLHFDKPNPEINFSNGPFYVNTSPVKWQNINNFPLRAGVSSFGIGGTNSHIVLEEFVEESAHLSNRKYQILRVSAKSEKSLIEYQKQIQTYLNEDHEFLLCNISFTLHEKRADFPHRSFACLSDANIDEFSFSKTQTVTDFEFKNIAFMFPGGGTQYVNMAREIYETETHFRNTIDKGLFYLGTINDKNYRDILFSLDSKGDINKIENLQPLLFLVEYAIADLFMHWGIRPKYLIGHSLGEYTAACISGIFSFEDALKIVTKRGRLMAQSAKGGMLSISSRIENFHKDFFLDVDIAAINSQESFVVSGAEHKIDELETLLTSLDISFHRIVISTASHSRLMDEILDEFQGVFQGTNFSKPVIPIISNQTGKPLTDEQACSSIYWKEHLRKTVNFNEGISFLLNEKCNIFIEMGPGKSLMSLVGSHLESFNDVIIINTIRHALEKVDDSKVLSNTLGILWMNGIDVNDNYYEYEKYNQISIPSYVFNKTSLPYKVDPVKSLFQKNENKISEDVSQWVYQQTWKQRKNQIFEENECFNSTIVFVNESHFSRSLIKRISSNSNKVITVFNSKKYYKESSNVYFIDGTNLEDFKLVLSNVQSELGECVNVLYLLGTENEFDDKNYLSKVVIEEELDQGYFSVLNLVRALNELTLNKVYLNVIVSNLFLVKDKEFVRYGLSPIVAALKVISKEYSFIHCNLIEYCAQEFCQEGDQLMDLVIKEINKRHKNETISIRYKQIWEPSYERVFPTNKRIDEIRSFKTKGTYLITGGRGGIAQFFTEYLSVNYNANIILIVRDNAEKMVAEGDFVQGSNVYYLNADVSADSFASRLSSFLTAEKLKVDGVIHAAGIADFYGLISDRSNSNCSEIFKAKIFGTINLFKTFSNSQLDFFIFCSSNSSLFAPFGQVGYVAANTFQNFFALMKDSKIPLISLLWDSWKEVGMAVNARNRKSINQETKEYLDNIGMLNKDGAVILEAAVRYPLQNFIISMKDFDEWIKHSDELTLDNIVQEVKKLNVNINQERPVLSVNYLEPSSLIEKKLCLIWEEFFGIQRIGVNDDFFEIGGDSLKALTLSHIIRKELNVSVSIKDIFMKGNIRFLAKEIELILSIASVSDGNVGNKNYKTIKI